MTQRGVSSNLQGHLVAIGGRVGFQFEPVAAFTSLGFIFVEPHPFHIGISLGAYTTHHSVRVQGIHDSGVVLGSLAPGFAPHKEGILQRDKVDHSQASKTNASEYDS